MGKKWHTVMTTMTNQLQSNRIDYELLEGMKSKQEIVFDP